MSVESQGLLSISNGHFYWNKSRMPCFVGMLMALIQVRSVNLEALSCGFASEAKKASSYKRMQRFFHHFSIDLSMVDSVGFALEDFSALRYMWKIANEGKALDALCLIPELTDPKDLYGLVQEKP